MRKSGFKKTLWHVLGASLFAGVLTCVTYCPKNQFIPSALYVTLVIAGVIGIVWPLFRYRSAE